LIDAEKFLSLRHTATPGRRVRSSSTAERFGDGADVRAKATGQQHSAPHNLTLVIEKIMEGRRETAASYLQADGRASSYMLLVR
jgi:hypothetical protein